MSTLRPPMSAALETRPLNVKLQFLRENIQKAQRKNCPKSEHTPAVLIFISWARDSIAENKHRLDLAILFEKAYHYYLEEYTIPNDVGTTTAYQKMNEVLSVFMKRHDVKDTPLIVVSWRCPQNGIPVHMVVSDEPSFRTRKAEIDLENRADVAPESPAID